MKYLYSFKDMSVTLKKGNEGTLTFGVGGPVAAREVIKLAEEVNALLDENADLREALFAALAVLSLYANENNWVSINGIMTLKTLSHPWADAQMALKKLEPK